MIILDNKSPKKAKLKKIGFTKKQKYKIKTGLKLKIIYIDLKKYNKLEKNLVYF